MVPSVTTVVVTSLDEVVAEIVVGADVVPGTVVSTTLLSIKFVTNAIQNIKFR